jgi:PiT family inorganic phosphate transporter
MLWIYLLPSLFMGWSLGTNDSANIFGPTVAQKVVKYRTAIIVAAIFIIIGSWVGGSAGMATLSSITHQDLVSASVAVLSAAIVVTFMSKLGIPVSTSQAVLGGILGIGVFNHDVNFAPLIKVLIVWVINPVGAMGIAIVLQLFLGHFYKKINSVSLRSNIVKWGALIIGAYGSYALGANNVANVTGAFAGPLFKNNYPLASLVGGLAIASGTLTYSKKVMMTVGKDIAALDSFGSVVAVLAISITVWIFSLIGVPVSTSQAIVGAVIGIGFLKGISFLNKKTIIRIILGWVATPTVAGVMAFVVYLIIKLL